MKKFIRTIAVFSLFPLILVILYVSLDPFKVIYHYDSYYASSEKAQVYLNRDYVGTSAFINFYDKYNYNSFILGSSRTLFYEADEWAKYSEVWYSPFHFDASNESLYGVHKKVVFLDEKINIGSALLVLDHELLKQLTAKRDILFSTSPALVDNRNLIPFHSSFFTSFLQPHFFVGYFDYLVTNSYRDYMPLNTIIMDYDFTCNEIKYSELEEMIANNKYYDDKRMKAFYHRNYTDSIGDPILKDRHITILLDIKRIFDRHKTDYKVIISPLYDQIYINPLDLKILRDIFGGNVYDFSGKNDITDNYVNYYEASHYRPHVASYILDSVYNGVIKTLRKE